MKKKEIIYNVVVFYDVSSESLSWKSLYDFALKFMEKYQQKPSRMTLSGTQIKPSSKTKSFRHYNKVIQNLSFREISLFWIGAGYSENPGGDQHDCFIGFSADCHYGKEIFLYFRDEIIPYESSLMKSLAFIINKNSNSLYGTAFQLDQKEKGPMTYLAAILNPDDSHEMESSILNWDHAYNDPYSDCGTYKTGDFRDLYPLNFIGEAHLKRDVFGQTLREWIEADLARGTLEPLNETLWTWEIPQENISDLRQQLKPTDLLVCFRPYE